MGTRDAGGPVRLAGRAIRVMDWQSEPTKSTRQHTYTHTPTDRPNSSDERTPLIPPRLGLHCPYRARAYSQCVSNHGRHRPHSVPLPSHLLPRPSVSLYSINQSINQSCTGVAIAINECLELRGQCSATVYSRIARATASDGKYRADQLSTGQVPRCRYNNTSMRYTPHSRLGQFHKTEPK